VTWLAFVAADAAEAAKVAKHEAITPLQRMSNREPRERRSRDGGQDTKPGESATPRLTMSCIPRTGLQAVSIPGNPHFPSLLQR